MRISKTRLWELAGRMGFWLVIFAITFWSFNRDDWMSMSTAHADTATATATTSSTNTNCTSSGSQYGGGTWNWCNSSDPAQQQNTQNNAQNLNNNGSNQSSMLGMMAIAAGMAMVAAGMAMMAQPPTAAAGAALVAAGMMLIASGMAALAAASQMNNNGNQAGTNAENLGDLNGAPLASTTASGSSLDTGTTANIGTSSSGASTLGSGNSSGIKIDPALLHTGIANDILQNMANQTGLNPDDVANALQNGANPLGLLANSPALANNPGASQDNLQKMMDSATANNPPLSAQEVMDKLGVTKDDLAAMSGANANRGLASKDGPNLDALFPGGDKAAAAPAAAQGNGMKISSEVQAALDRSGITSRNLFEMVHTQYVKKTPLMFGVQQKADGTKVNPFNGLGNEKVEL